MAKAAQNNLSEEQMTETATNDSGRVLFDFISESEGETLEFGKQFASHLQPGSVVAFFGNLGSGKTTCIKGICAALGVQEPVTSPTFTLINEYKGKLPIYHFDFYRINSETELVDLGIEEYFYGQGVCLIEWPEIVINMLPANRFEVHLEWRFEPNWETKRKIKVVKR